MEREIDRFTMRAEDGRSWRFRTMQSYKEWTPLKGGTQNVTGSHRYESLDDDDRFSLVELGGGRYAVRDFRSHASDTEVSRVGER